MSDKQQVGVGSLVSPTVVQSGTLGGGIDISGMNILINKLELLTNEILQLRKDFNNMDKKINDNFKKHDVDIDHLKKENIKLKRKVTSLEQLCNENCQYGRYNGIKLINIPEKEDENVMNIIKEISNSIGFQFEERMVDSCYRIQTKNLGGPIIIKFIRNLDKLEFLKMKKARKIFLLRIFYFRQPPPSPYL